MRLAPVPAWFGALLVAGGLAALAPRDHAARVPSPPPPTPAALATVAADARVAAERAETARREAAEREEAARLAAVQNPPETEDVLPAGHGRSEVFGLCTACHNTAIIRRSGLSRDRWDGLMDWMTEKHGMPPLEGEMRTLVVDYLAGNFAPRRSPRNASNPFLQN